MDARKQRVLEHIQHANSFVCCPARAALKKGTLLTPNSFDPEDECLDKKIKDIMRSLLKNPMMEGALLISTKDPVKKNKDVSDLLPTIAGIVRAAKIGTENVMELDHTSSYCWELLLKGHTIGAAEIQWGDPALSPYGEEGILITAHGPVYPHQHPRYQPHPALAIIQRSVVQRISMAAKQMIFDQACSSVGRFYESDTFLLPLTSERQW